jgi:hypothetical protein
VLDVHAARFYINPKLALTAEFTRLLKGRVLIEDKKRAEPDDSALFCCRD